MPFHLTPFVLKVGDHVTRNQRIPDQRTPDQRTPDQRTPDQRTPDQRTPDQRVPPFNTARWPGREFRVMELYKERGLVILKMIGTVDHPGEITMPERLDMITAEWFIAD